MYEVPKVEVHTRTHRHTISTLEMFVDWWEDVQIQK